MSKMDVKRLIFHADTTRGLTKLPYLPEGRDEYLLGKEGRLLFVYVRTKKKKSQLSRATALDVKEMHL